MALSHIEHFLIQTDDLEGTRDWYIRTLGFVEGTHPDFKFPVVWLYLGDQDVIHITQGGSKVSANRLAYLGQQSHDVRGSGAVDHIAFRCTGLAEMLERLAGAGVEFRKRMVDDQGLFQLFMMDPNGIKIELNFANAEAEGIRPDLMASALPA